MNRRSHRPWSILGNAVARFFPPACAGCDGHTSPEQAFCALCSPLAGALEAPRCAICAVPMEEFSSTVTTESECSRCRSRPPAFERIRARWKYDGAVADALRRVKYGDDFAALRALCRGARPWFHRQLATLPDDAPIIPVPSHDRALRRRGFHVPTMALHLLGGRHHSRRIDHRLIKTEETPRQASLPLAARRANVRGVFAAANTCPRAKGAAILFDDVVTTGATADEASRALSEAGFDHIFVLTLARAPDRSKS